MEKVKVSIIVLNYNTPEITLNCLESIVKNTRKTKYEVILIDNGSTEKFSISNYSTRLRRQFSKITLIRNSKNLGFAKANNQGIKAAKGEYLLLLNSDTLVNSDVVYEMAKWMDKHSKVGIASCKLLNADGSVQGTGGYFPSLLRVFSWMSIEDFPFVEKLIKPFHPLHAKSFYKNSGFYDKKQELDWLTGAFLFIRKEVVEQIGLIDEDYFMYTEDTDFCYRAKVAGWKVMYLPRWNITHLGGASSNAAYPIVSEFQSVKLFYQKHYAGWQYPILRFLLKVGALSRIVLFGVLYGKEARSTYVQAYKAA